MPPPAPRPDTCSDPMNHLPSGGGAAHTSAMTLRDRSLVRLAIGSACLLTLACDKKADMPSAEGEGNSPTIQAAPGDIVPESAAASDTTPGIPVTPPPAPGKTPTGKSPTMGGSAGGTVIGYDSAFGPSYELDSAGRPIPFKKRKP